MSNKYRSETIGVLIGSLSKAQGLYKSLVANEESPHGKFANLHAILASVKEALAANGLAFYQYIEQLDEGAGAVILYSILGHESNEFISSSARIIIGKNERNNGNIYEIHKRRHACMLLGIAPSKSDPMGFDDDGEQIAEDALIDALRKPREPIKEELDRNDTVNNEQYQELLIELDDYPEITKDILSVYDITTLADLPKSEYHKARSKILKIKRTTEDYRRTRR